MNSTFFYSLREIRRDWRAREIVALGMAVAISVGAVTAVLGFADRVTSGLERSAGEVIAADIKLASRDEFPGEFSEKALELGLKVAHTVSFPTVIFDDGRTLLSSVKGVSDRYPLRGELQVQTVQSGPRVVAAHAIPARGELWVDARVLSSMDLVLGDQLKLGEKSFTLGAVLTYEPDRGGQFFSFSPRLMANITDLEETGLLGPSSRARYALLAAGPSEVVEQFADIVDDLPSPKYTIIDLESAQEQVGATVTTSRDFIGMATLATLLIAGISIAVASRRYTERRRRHAALLRCFGATSREVLLIYGQTLFLLSLFWGFAGMLLGYFVQEIMSTILGEFFTSELGEIDINSGLVGLLLGTILLLGFSLPSLSRLTRVSPTEVLRKVERARYQGIDRVWHLVSIIIFLILAYTQTRSVELVGLVLFAVIGVLVAMMGCSAFVLTGLRKFSRGVGVSWRFGLGRLFRDRMASTFQISALGIGLTVLITLSLIRVQLFESWEARTPDDAPNFFFANIQDHEKNALKDFFSTRVNLAPSFTPMATGRLVSINGTIPSVDEYPDPRTASRIDGNLNFSWSGKLPQGNRLVDGEWWDATTTEPVVSLAQSWAEPLRVKVGDRIGVRVGTEEIDALIVNIREVQWENFNPNFFVLFPPNVFANAPHTYLSSTRLEGQNQDTLVSLNQLFPTINIIDIGVILKQVRRLLDLVGLALNLVFGFTLAAGSVALYSVMQSGHEARVRDVAMLKVLGCDRRRIMMALGAEFLTISLIAGLVAGISASMIGWLLAAQIFDIPYQFNPFVLVFSVFLSAIIVAALSMSHVKHALRTAPKFALLWI